LRRNYWSKRYYSSFPKWSTFRFTFFLMNQTLLL
jgi:hypothetical protein